jgi:hypothetical protein
MQLADTDGHLLDATFDIQGPDESGALSLVLESAGGASGSTGSRNRQYPRVLAILLSRLAEAGADLVDAFVESRATRHLSAEDRRIAPRPWTLPLHLADVEDFNDLRRAVTRPQGSIGSRSTKGGGNERKRIRLHLTVPGDLGREQLLDTLGAVHSSPRPSRSPDLARGLSESDVLAAITEWRQTGRDEFVGRYAASPAQRYVLVVDGEEFDAMAILRSARAHAGLDTTTAFRGDRRAVAEPLRALGFEVDDLRPDAEGPLGPDAAAYLGRTPPEFIGPTDTWTVRAARREQRWLKSALGIGTGNPHHLHTCGLCGRHVPERLLVAAHIKPRSKCDDAERKAFLDIAMPACILGCDSLFEHGYISVDQHGRILCATSNSLPPALSFDLLDGKSAPAWNVRREQYFQWHRENRYLG